MTIAALYDIHGNLPALEAVLADVHQSQATHLLAGGDILLGPMSIECLELLINLELPAYFIKGNCETSVLNLAIEGISDQTSNRIIDDLAWTAKQLTEEHRKHLSRWPLTLKFDFDGLGNVMFCHATPRNEFEIFTQLTAEKKLSPIFNIPEVDCFICGHTHMVFDREIGTVRIINAGSVGMPFDKPGAHWLLVDDQIEFHSTNYNTKEAAERIRKTDYPFAEEFVQKYVLNTPDQIDMLELLTRNELT